MRSHMAIGSLVCLAVVWATCQRATQPNDHACASGVFFCVGGVFAYCDSELASRHVDCRDVPDGGVPAALRGELELCCRTQDEVDAATPLPECDRDQDCPTTGVCSRARCVDGTCKTVDVDHIVCSPSPDARGICYSGNCVDYTEPPVLAAAVISRRPQQTLDSCFLLDLNLGGYLDIACYHGRPPDDASPSQPWDVLLTEVDHNGQFKLSLQPYWVGYPGYDHVYLPVAPDGQGVIGCFQRSDRYLVVMAPRGVAEPEVSLLAQRGAWGALRNDAAWCAGYLTRPDGIDVVANLRELGPVLIQVAPDWMGAEILTPLAWAPELAMDFAQCTMTEATGDGLADLLVLRGGELYIVPQTNPGMFDQAIPTGLYFTDNEDGDWEPLPLTAEDLNGDGFPDLIGKHGVALSTGPGDWAQAYSFSTRITSAVLRHTRIGPLIAYRTEGHDHVGILGFGPNGAIDLTDAIDFDSGGIALLYAGDLDQDFIDELIVIRESIGGGFYTVTVFGL